MSVWPGWVEHGWKNAGPSSAAWRQKNGPSAGFFFPSEHADDESRGLRRIRGAAIGKVSTSGAVRHLQIGLGPVTIGMLRDAGERGSALGFRREAIVSSMDSLRGAGCDHTRCAKKKAHRSGGPAACRRSDGGACESRRACTAARPPVQCRWAAPTKPRAYDSAPRLPPRVISPHGRRGLHIDLLAHAQRCCDRSLLPQLANLADRSRRTLPGAQSR